MPTVSGPHAGSDLARNVTPQLVPNGAALAAVLAGAIGSATLGALVILGATGVLALPVLYAPAGGLSTRTTVAVIVWLGSWGVLHRQWKDHSLSISRVGAWATALVIASIVTTFPPLWDLLK